MDNDGWTTKRRGRGRNPSEIPEHPRTNAWMEANCPPYSGSAADYDNDHFNQYGRAEGMVKGVHVRPDGSPDPKPSFPPGTSREKAHQNYSNSTMAGNSARDHYKAALKRNEMEFQGITDEEKRKYFEHVSDGLLPRQHEDMAPRAERWDDTEYRQADGRLDLMVNNKVAYHSLQSFNEHRNYAHKALRQHADAHPARIRHARLRSDRRVDKRTDCWGEPVPTRFVAHTRSRTHELPPEGTYSPRHTTPSPKPRARRTLRNDGHGGPSTAAESATTPTRTDWWGD